MIGCDDDQGVVVHADVLEMFYEAADESIKELHLQEVALRGLGDGPGVVDPLLAAPHKAGQPVRQVRTLLLRRPQRQLVGCSPRQVLIGNVRQHHVRDIKPRSPLFIGQSGRV